jgi:O-acetylhomoserine/O-acetylserine sulfhydrylase-like pyridoxal-dependent enzyme
VVPLRNTGAALSPFNAFLILQGIETLALRMDRICQRAGVAQYLKRHPKVRWVNYAGLEDHPDHALAQKYFKGRASGVLTFGVARGATAALPGCAATVHAAGQHRRRQVAGHASRLPPRTASCRRPNWPRPA